MEDIIGDSNGTVAGLPKLVEGINGNALEFDGVADFINVPAKNFNRGNQPMTVSAWVFLKEGDKVAGPTFHTIFNVGIGHIAGQCFWVATFTGRRRGVFQIRTTQCVENGPYDAVGPDLTLNEWHHVAGVYNGAKKNLLYLDGVEVGTRDTPAEPDVHFPPDEFGVIGGKFDPRDELTGALWPGIIDEVGFYNRALTPE